MSSGGARRAVEFCQWHRGLDSDAGGRDSRHPDPFRSAVRAALFCTAPLLHLSLCLLQPLPPREVAGLRRSHFTRLKRFCVNHLQSFTPFTLSFTPFIHAFHSRVALPSAGLCLMTTSRTVALHSPQRATLCRGVLARPFCALSTEAVGSVCREGALVVMMPCNDQQSASVAVAAATAAMAALGRQGDGVGREDKSWGTPQARPPPAPPAIKGRHCAVDRNGHGDLTLF